MTHSMPFYWTACLILAVLFTSLAYWILGHAACRVVAFLICWAEKDPDYFKGKPPADKECWHEWRDLFWPVLLALTLFMAPLVRIIGLQEKKR